MILKETILAQEIVEQVIGRAFVLENIIIIGEERLIDRLFAIFPVQLQQTFLLLVGQGKRCWR